MVTKKWVEELVSQRKAKFRKAQVHNHDSRAEIEKQERQTKEKETP